MIIIGLDDIIFLSQSLITVYVINKCKDVWSGIYSLTDASGLVPQRDATRGGLRRSRFDDLNTWRADSAEAEAQAQAAGNSAPPKELGETWVAFASLFAFPLTAATAELSVALFPFSSRSLSCLLRCDLSRRSMIQSGNSRP